MHTRLPSLFGLILLTACSSGPPPEARPADQPPSSQADASAFYDACLQGGLSEQACRCAQREAVPGLGAPLLEKMAAAPADDDPKLAEYYTGEEVQRIMSWVDATSEACDVEAL